jgi:hypothetical protein
MPETGAFYAVLVQTAKAWRLLENGTSNGYSTLYCFSPDENGDLILNMGGRDEGLIAPLLISLIQTFLKPALAARQLVSNFSLHSKTLHAWKE